MWLGRMYVFVSSVTFKQGIHSDVTTLLRDIVNDRHPIYVYLFYIVFLFIHDVLIDIFFL